MSDQKNFAGKFHFIFNCIMIALYTLAGILLIFILHLEQLPSFNTKAVGAVFLIYAAYRGYKLYREHASQPNGNNAE